jgi:hypothetical protein
LYLLDLQQPEEFAKLITVGKRGNDPIATAAIPYGQKIEPVEKTVSRPIPA